MIDALLSFLFYVVIPITLVIVCLHSGGFRDSPLLMKIEKRFPNGASYFHVVSVRREGGKFPSESLDTLAYRSKRFITALTALAFTGLAVYGLFEFVGQMLSGFSPEI